MPADQNLADWLLVTLPRAGLPPHDPLLQVWHNYSFDRHVMERLGLRMAGFGGDTMHMARLWDSSRMTRGGYSLQALSGQRC